MHIARSKEHNGSNSREERWYLLNLEKASHQPHPTQTFWCCWHEVTAFATWLLKYKLAREYRRRLDILEHLYYIYWIMTKFTDNMLGAVL